MRRHFKTFHTRAGAVILALGVHAVGSTALSASDYDQRRASAIKACEAIDPARFQTGLVFNPDGYRSFYLRSQCFQEAAVVYRDETICAQVKQRPSLFSSSWGYSASRCRDLVKQGRDADRNELDSVKRLYRAGPLTMQGFRIERNGNGRDFDIIPTFTGTYAHGYQLTFEILDPDARRQPALLHTDGYYVNAGANLRLYVRQSDVRQRLPDLVLGRVYAVRATMTLSIGMGGPSGYWSDAFIEQVFPARERTQSLIQNARF